MEKIRKKTLSTLTIPELSESTKNEIIEFLKNRIIRFDKISQGKRSIEIHTVLMSIGMFVDLNEFCENNNLFYAVRGIELNKISIRFNHNITKKKA